QPVRRRPRGEGVVRRPLPAPAPPDPGGGHLHRHRRPCLLVGQYPPARVHGSAVMRWLLACGVMFGLALILFVVPASAEGPVLVRVSAGHGLSLVDVAALVPLLAGTGLLAGGLWRRRQGLDAALSRQPWLARAGAVVARLRVGRVGAVGVPLFSVGVAWSAPPLRGPRGGPRTNPWSKAGNRRSHRVRR